MLKGNSTGNLMMMMNFTYMLEFGLVSGVVKVFSGQFSFVGEKIDQEGTAMMWPDDEMGSQIGRVTSRPSQDKN